MKVGKRFAAVLAIMTIGAAPFWGCVSDATNDTANDGGDGGSGDTSTSDGNTTDDGASIGDSGDKDACGPCSVACDGTKCPSAPVQVTTWCSDFVNATNATNDSSCVLLESGDVYCWGFNANGELGLGDTTVRTVATKIATDANGDPFSAVEIAMGVSHACARKADGSIWCWGINVDGECGQTPSGTPITRPTRVGSLTGYQHIYAKGYFTCGIDSSSQVTCWGSNDQDSLGNTGGSNQVPTTIAFQAGNLTSTNVSIGDQGGCAQVVDNAYCWGTNRNKLLGELGGGNPDSPTPVSIGDVAGTMPLENVAGVARGRYTAFALLTTNVVVGWGDDDFGALGFAPAADNQLDPRYFGGGQDAGAAVGNVVQVSPGLAHTCVRKSDGSILCAGINALLQQGTNAAITATCTSADSTDYNVGSSPCTTTPLPLASSTGSPVTGAIDVAAGCGITCFIGSDHKVYCEGNDTFGQTARASNTGDVACTYDSLTGPFKCAGTPAAVQGLP